MIIIIIVIVIITSNNNKTDIEISVRGRPDSSTD